MPKKLTKIEIINRAHEVHGYKYIYDKMEYVNTKTKVCITCPIHGDFWQKIGHHLEGCGCPKCSGNVKFTNDNFIKESKKVHGNKYDYSKVEYVNNHTKICIICPIHGEFWQTPKKHLTGQGCPECKKKNISIKKALPFESFYKEALKVHGDKYKYNKDTYFTASKKTEIICPIHGKFWQTPIKHLMGQECPECSKNKRAEKKTLGIDRFVEKAKILHRNKYEYNEGVYVNYETKIKIICPVHGDFWQSPDSHLQGCGCPKCSHKASKSEEEINDYINQICNLKTIIRDRTLLGEGLECDIIIPSHRLAIEFDGLRWHSEEFKKDKKYHLYKTELAESKGYHLIHIFEDEWLEHKELVLDKIKHFLGCDNNKSVIGARKCTVKTVSKTLIEPFLNRYHIQGFVPSTAYYGAFYGDILVGVMTFKQEKQGMWNLTRFASNINYRLSGLASKIFKQFVKDNNPIEVKTFLDRRWSHTDNNLYDRMGFELIETLPPDYRYVVKNQRVHKFNFRKQILAKNYNLPLTMTEKEMTEQLGIYRIWDCGLYKYIWKKGND